MSKNRLYAERAAYIELLSLALQPLQDFGQLEYAYAPEKSSEYLKVSTVFGDSVFLDITAMPEEEILKELCRMVLNINITSDICDLEQKRQIMSLFKRKNY